jgi:cardiolipin hydrolase
MAEPTWEAVLKESLQDLNLSRGEKAVLQHAIAGHVGDDHQVNLIRNKAFQLAREKLVDPNSKSVLNWLEKVMNALAHQRQNSGDSMAEAWFSPDAPCVTRINQLLDRAKQRIDICVFTITDDRITERILEAHARGVKVQVISDDDKATDLGSDVYNLKSRGIAVRTDSVPDHMHHKYAIFDRETLLTGSYNWTRSAAKANQDNFIVTDHQGLVHQFSNHFNQLWKELEG